MYMLTYEDMKGYNHVVADNVHQEDTGSSTP
jgi:hypothetical protein